MFTTKRKIHNLLHNATNRGAAPSISSSPTKSPTATRNIGENKDASVSETSLDLAKDGPTTDGAKSLYQLPKSNNSLSSLIDESIRKRRRVEMDLARAKSMATPLQSSRPGTPGGDSRASSVAPSVSGTGTSPKVIKVAAARYAPWDRNEFLQRLETFRSVSNWSSKPEKINEVAWAKRGWVCMQTSKNRVRCTSHCGGELVVKIDFDGFEVTAEEIEEEYEDDETAQGKKEKLDALISKYEELIVDGHEDGCLWKKRGCDKAIYRLPLQPATEARSGFYARYKSLTNVSDDQLVINLTRPQEVDTSVLNLPEDMTKEHLKQNALILALFGWSKEDNESSVEMVKCDACFRRLGLWLFVKRPSVTEEDGDEFSSMSRLNVVDEHRDYCPWINPTSQTGEHAGWEILLRILKSGIPGNLVAAPSPARPKTAAVLPHKTEEEHRKDDENRWKRLKSLRKSYGSSFAMSILGGKKGEKHADKSAQGGSPAKGTAAS